MRVGQGKWLGTSVASCEERASSRLWTEQLLEEELLGFGVGGVNNNTNVTCIMIDWVTGWIYLSPTVTLLIFRSNPPC